MQYAGTGSGGAIVQLHVQRKCQECGDYDAACDVFRFAGKWQCMGCLEWGGMVFRDETWIDPAELHDEEEIDGYHKQQAYAFRKTS